MSDEVIKITNKNSRRMPTLAAYPSSHIAESWLDTSIPTSSVLIDESLIMEWPCKSS